MRMLSKPSTAKCSLGADCTAKPSRGINLVTLFYEAIRNHLFCALRAFVELALQRWRGEIKSGYGLKRHLVDAVVTHFI